MPKRTRKVVEGRALLRRAFDLIPQLPDDPEVALQVLQHAMAMAPIRTDLDREHRRLACDIVDSLPKDGDDAGEILLAAIILWKRYLMDDEEEMPLGRADPNVIPLRIVGDR